MIPILHGFLGFCWSYNCWGKGSMCQNWGGQQPGTAGFLPGHMYGKEVRRDGRCIGEHKLLLGCWQIGEHRQVGI